MEMRDTLAERVHAALRGAVAAATARERLDLVELMVSVAEVLATHGSLDVDEIRRRGGGDTAGPSQLLLRVVPIGLATPTDRPRLRRDAYRCASLTGADEGTAVACVGAALIAADLLRFDLEHTAVRVRQSLLEDAPMALLNRISGGVQAELIVEPDSDDPGAAIQTSLAAVREGHGVRSVVELLADARPEVAILAAALAGAAVGTCDLDGDPGFTGRADRAADGLSELAMGTVVGEAAG